MAGAGKKTFTAGETLTASDVNTYLMEQSVMVFGGTAARASAIPTPSTGMTSYIGVTGTATIPQIETYTGSAWQTPYGLTQVANVSFTSSASVSIDNVFTSAYRNYKILWNVSAYTGSPTLNLRLRSSGTDIGTAGTDYTYGNVYFATSVVTGARSTGASVYEVQQAIGGASASFSLDVFNPQATEITRITGNGFMPSGVPVITGGSYQLTTSVDGFTMYLNTGTMTGSARIYGYRNS